MGGAGIGRPLALFEHLPEHGYECHVLTVKPVAYRVFEEDLLEGLPTEHVYRAGSTDPQRLMRLMGLRKVKGSMIDRGRSVADRYFPDTKIGWVRKAVKLGRDLLNNRDYDAIISTSPPISSHLVGHKLAREFSRPWIADFRDYWATTVRKPEEEFANDPGKIRRIGQLLEQFQRDATAITAVNKSVAAYVGAGETIFNCYNEKIARRWKEPSGDGPFTIGVLGALNENTPIEPLLRVLERMRREQRALFDRIEVVQVGEADPDWLTEELGRFDMAERFTTHGVQHRVYTIDLLNETSVLYAGVSSEKLAGLSTGRIYTMLSSGRPILAHAPAESEIAELLKPVKEHTRFFGEETGAAAAFLTGLMERSERGEGIVEPNPEYAKRYASGEMTRRFVHILDEIEFKPYR